MLWSENAGIIIPKCSDQETCFYWEIPNYFTYQTKEYTAEQVVPRIVSSPWFIAFNNKWRLALKLNRKRGHTEYVGFFLWMMPSSNEAPKINAKLILNNCDGNEYKSCDGDVDLNGRFGYWYFIDTDLLFDAKEQISSAGILKFVCVMEKKVPIVLDSQRYYEYSEKENEKADETATSENGAENEIPEAKGVDRLLENLKNIFLGEEGSDAILKVEGRDFKVHKTILIARSPVFTSMFKYDTKENTTGTVDIPDCSAAAFEAFLLYLYTASTDAMSQENVFDLYYAADKYQVNDLKSECVEYMENNLSTENFCDVMTLSLKHSESGLQKKAMDFFCDNFKRIIKTVQWQKYLREYPTEANELYIKAVNA